MDNVEKIPALKISQQEAACRTEEPVAIEFLATIFLNDEELVTLACSPNHLDYLAVGFLGSQGLLQDKNQIMSLSVDDLKGIIQIETKAKTAQVGSLKRLITSGCGGRATFYSVDDAALPKVESDMKIAPDEVLNLVKEFQQSSRIYKLTHGVHSAALCDRNRIIVFDDDIGRHNAVDKVFGKCFTDDITVADKVLVVSGRVSLDILQKAARRRVPIVISISVPTDAGAKAAARLGITLIGSVRPRTMKVYANDWRLTP